RSRPVVYPPPPNTAQLWEQWEYDGMGRVVRHVAPWFAETTYQYLGRSVITTGPGGAVTRTEQDALGRPVEIVDAEGGTTSYAYGPFGGLRSVTDPGGAKTVTLRDEYGRVRQSEEPDRGKVEAHYNGFDELLASVDAAQRVVQRTYDPLGRPRMQADNDGTTLWTWDTAAHGVGQLAEVTGPDGHALRFGYDALGRPLTTSLRIEGETFTTSVTYDAQGRVEAIQYPAAPGVGPFAVQHERDVYGHLRAVKDAASGAEIWRATGIDLGGRMTGEQFGGGVVTTTRTIDGARERVTSITTTGAVPVQQLSYTWSDRLKLQERQDGLHGQAERFKHDNLDRLICVGTPPYAVCPAAAQIQYAPNGNLLYKPGVGAYSYDPAKPHAAVAAGASAYAYDAVGNQWSRPGATIGYTAFDLPKVVTLDSGEDIRFEYDGAQQRVRKTTLAEETVYVGGLYERVTDFATGAVEHRYHVHAGGRAVATMLRGVGEPPKTRYLHVDHLGSIDAVTDESGAVVHRRSYDAFGARRDPIWSAPVPASFPASEIRQGFTAHEGDDELGLVHMIGRVFDPKLGRFLTPDPIVAHPQFGQSWNPYSYVLNSPLSRVDPSGFTDEPPGQEFVDGPPDLTVWIVGPAREGKPPATPAPPPRPPPPQKSTPQPEAAEALAVHPPTDLYAWGNSAGWMPAESPVVRELPRLLEIGARIQFGGWSALQETALGALSFVGLTMVTFGGYASYSTGRAVWGGYREFGILGALNALNPLYHLAKSAVDTFMAADRGDWEAVGQGGVKTGVAAVGVVATVAGAAAAGAARGGAAGAARSGAAAGGATHYREVFFNRHPHLRGQVVVHHAVEQQVLKRYPGLFSATTMRYLHMEQRWNVSPEVAGELGEGTDMDSNVHPPRLRKLHHRFEGWMGDDILECFPVFLVTQRLAHALIDAGLTGFNLREVEVSVSPEFEELHPDLVLPKFYWLAVDAGRHASTDFRIDEDLRLEVNDRALVILKKFHIEHASIELIAGQ
ncbi:MAG TPA: RHS repeat-associated core domain-containing protein, partial [Candidatus Nanopelagicales bacterium]|nr:RHS repeat-associated core domain-containing protein [Candidatus Nanopelagicales bacterium]